MKDKKGRVVIFFFFVAVMFFFLFKQSDEDEIKKVFKGITQVVELKKSDKLMNKAGKFTGIKEFIADNCIIEVSAYKMSGNYTKDAVASHVAKAHGFCTELSVEFSEFNITHLNEIDANVVLNTKVTGLMRSGSDIYETKRLTCRLEKLDGNWVLTDIHSIKESE